MKLGIMHLFRFLVLQRTFLFTIYAKWLSSNPDISQKYKMGDMSKRETKTHYTRQQIYKKYLLGLEILIFQVINGVIVNNLLIYRCSILHCLQHCFLLITNAHLLAIFIFAKSFLLCSI